MKKLLIAALISLPVILWAGPDPRGIFELEGYSNSDSVGITAKRAKNDFTIKEPVSASDTLFFIKGFGYNGTDFSSTPRAQITFNAGQTWTPTANGADIRFSVTPNGSTTMSEAVRISTNGYTGFGTSNPQSVVDVAGSLGLYARTSAQIKVTTPTAVGQTLFDTTLKQPVFATGTSTCFDWVTSTGTRPAGY